MPISYSGRTYQEGKKIGWRDGVKALVAIARFRISDEVYVKDAYGSHILARLARAPKFNAWMADVIRPYCGNRVLEIGAGVGNLTLRLVPRARLRGHRHQPAAPADAGVAAHRPAVPERRLLRRERSRRRFRPGRAASTPSSA